jgi:peroxiredoxin
MKRILCLLSFLLCLSARADLLPGTVAPDFTLPAARAGQVESLSLSTLLQKGPVVLWFYPKAFTSGCTAEAGQFAEAAAQFAALGATVVGVSADALDTLQVFSVKECRGAYAVASDPQGKVIRAYDAQLLLGSTAKRVTYVITPDGKVYSVWSAMSAGAHVSKSLAALKAWQDSKPAASD